MHLDITTLNNYRRSYPFSLSRAVGHERQDGTHVEKGSYMTKPL